MCCQWGKVTSTGNNYRKVVFPISFTTTNYFGICNEYGRDNYTANGWGYINEQTKTGCGFVCSGTYWWFVIGY